MGWKICQKGGIKKLLSSATLVEPFHLLTTTLLNLLLPLSFILLGRLATARYLFTLAAYPKPQPSSPLISLFLHTIPIILHPLVSLISVAALIHGLTGRITLRSESTEPILRPRLYAAWILLCALQVCVGFGVEGSIAAGIDGTGFGHERGLISRVFFFLGLYETMLYWSRTVVKPVVDDTVFGFSKEERWVERVAMAASFGSLWWWRLRAEAEPLVVMVEVKKELSMDVGVGDLFGCWLYYLTVTIGMVRIVKGIMWLGVLFVCRRVRVEPNPGDSRGNEDKV
ncbi:uncharacterized protein LOC130791900 [Actinidia eriantha]|uniref:uncharacterized protein LOC130791900 n=1 Tax=Actinidia eriantha TaxID=165200 RepID=UPI00258C229B|nr:uncharacterized protein LOC130791900 [Actinidia eriantha]